MYDGEVLNGLHVSPASPRPARPAGSGALRRATCRLGNLAGRATDEMDAHLSAGGRRQSPHRQHQRQESRSRASTARRSKSRPSGSPEASTDTAAQELLPRIEIKEDVSPIAVSVETARMSGIMIGAAFEVRYHVRAPRNAVIDVTNTNGLIASTELSGKVVAHTTNGGVTGKGLSGGVDATCDQRPRQHQLARVGSDRIACTDQRRRHRCTVPESARPTSSATCTNGGISVDGREARDLGAVAPPPRRQVERRRHPSSCTPPTAASAPARRRRRRGQHRRDDARCQDRSRP